MSPFETALRHSVDGEIYFGDVHRAAYSVDASIYEIAPIGIVIPRSIDALVAAVKIAYQHKIPIIPRGAASGITGGCLGKGMIIDTSKYLHKILNIDFEKERVVCEPGVVQDRLNEQLSSRGYRLGPDTSTGDRATLGGMVANNSAGAHSLLYGCMADHIESLELVLATGEKVRLERVSHEEWHRKSHQSNTEGRLYRAFESLRNRYGKAIETQFPRLPRRVSGYSLDALLEKEMFNPCRLIAGSEGSLGIVTEMTLRIVKTTRCVGLCVVYLNDLLASLKHIEEMLAERPIAIELIDDRIIEMGKRSPSMKGKLDWLQGDPQGLLMLEFAGETQAEVNEKLAQCVRALQRVGCGFRHQCLTDPTTMRHVWELRKSGLGLLLSKRSYQRAIAFLEDVAVPPTQVASFLETFCQYLHNVGKSAGIYGHVGAGCLHIRPYIDLRQTDDVQLMERMMHDISDLLLKHGGVLSGEHGDGLVRSWLNRKMFGETLYRAFLELKEAFDPNHLMNPGKVVEGPPFLENLRMDPNSQLREFSPFLDFSREGGLTLAADLCNGNGRCRKMEGVMCPSFQATGEEFHSTRARAQGLRSVIHGRVPPEALFSPEMHDVFDLCLSCKGCKRECPSEVDVAKMKAEFLYQYHQKHGIPLRDRLIAALGQINRLGSLWPSFWNLMQSNPLSKAVLHLFGLTRNRTLPSLAKERFSYWFRRYPKKFSDKKVVLFIDTFTEFNHPEMGHAAVQLLERFGYEVLAPEWRCCGRPAISKGLLPQAKAMGERLIEELFKYAQQGLSIVVLEPSCLSALTDDYFGLLGSQHEKMKVVASKSELLEQFLLRNWKEDERLFHSLEIPAKILLHGHCHQKALAGTAPTLELLRKYFGDGTVIEEIATGCCGMAGAFGYEKEHYDISMKIGGLKLFPALKAEPEAIIVSNGFSCRAQIEHGTGRRAYHIAELLGRVSGAGSA